MQPNICGRLPQHRQDGMSFRSDSDQPFDSLGSKPPLPLRVLLVLSARQSLKNWFGCGITKCPQMEGTNLKL